MHYYVNCASHTNPRLLAELGLDKTCPYILPRQSKIHCRSTKRERLGVPPTEKKVNVTAMTVIHIVDGWIAEVWQAWNTFSVYQQMGGIPAKGESEE